MTEKKLSIEQRAKFAETLKAEAGALALASVDLQFKRHPELEKKYPAGGREKSVSDATHTVQVLAESIAAGSLTAFTGYIAWLTKVLISVKVPAKDLIEHLKLLGETCKDKLNPDLNFEVEIYLSAGIEEIKKVSK